MRRYITHIAAVIFALSFFGTVYGQTDRCPIMAKIPADLKDSESIQDRLWFELRQCNGESVIVRAYERHKTKPSLTFNTGSGYPSFIAHTFNVLVLESLGGSTDHVAVITFHEGKPSLALDRTGDNVQVKRTKDEVIVMVTPKTYPGPDGRFPSVPDSVYKFRLEY